MLKTFTKYLIADKCIDLFFSGINLNFNKNQLKLPIYGLTSWTEAMNIIRQDSRLVARYYYGGNSVWCSYVPWKNYMDANPEHWEDVKINAKYWDIDFKNDFKK